MLINLTLLYQCIFNTMHFAVLMPFVLQQDSMVVSVLYLSATLPSFLLTISINHWFKQFSVKKSLFVSACLATMSACLIIQAPSIFMMSIVLLMRSLFATIMIPKVSQYMGGLSLKSQQKYSLSLQLLLWSPGIIGYGLALLGSGLSLVKWCICLECLCCFGFFL